MGDKRLILTTRQGRTLSYPDTQRYRVGANHLQLPVNASQSKAQPRTDQRDGEMAYAVDAATAVAPHAGGKREEAAPARAKAAARR